MILDLAVGFDDFLVKSMVLGATKVSLVGTLRQWGYTLAVLGRYAMSEIKLRL